MFHVRRETIPLVVKAEIVLNCLYKKMSRNEEAQRDGVTLRMVDNIIYEFQQIKQVSKNIKKSINLRRTKIIKRHIKCLRKYIEEKSEKGSTLESARHHLAQRFPNIGNTCLRQSVGCSTTNSDLAIKS